MDRVRFLQSITNIPMEKILCDSFDTLMATYDLIGSYNLISISGDIDTISNIIITVNDSDVEKITSIINNKVIQKYGLSFKFEAQHTDNVINISVLREE